VVEAVSAAFSGKNPLTFADQLVAGLSGGPKQTAWSSGLQDRLRVLLVNAAFEAGLELNDLQDLGSAYPSLAAALDLKDFDALICLRYLWSLEADRPWERCGKASTVFDLAADDEQAETLLDRYPGLLLAVRGLPIFLTGRGLWCKNVCLREKPTEVELVKLPRGEGYHLVVGGKELWFDQTPERLVEELKRWVLYYFLEFQPNLRRFPVLRWGTGMQRLAGKNAVACPQCGRLLLPCLGEVGINMEET
jgi:hypothetical protein